MIKTRPATAADVPTILGFIRALAEYESLTHLMQATEQQLRTHLFGDRPAAEVLIGLLDGEPAGFALFFPNFSTFLGLPGIYLEDLFVIPAARRRGVAKALLAAVAELAVRRGCGRLEWSVLDWNQPAIDFYQRHGASILPDWRICRVTGEALKNLAAAESAGSAESGGVNP